jgi:tRNA (cmo5U34)-methyltransferase
MQGLATLHRVTNHLNEYATAEHALKYLALADRIPHRTEGESTLLELLPKNAQRIMDLGAGDGRLLALARIERPSCHGVALDFSATMLEAARKRFAGEDVEIIDHNLEYPLPALGAFDAVISSFAIHHCEDARKRSLYKEIFAVLNPGGVFLNLEHVSPGSPGLHHRFLAALGITTADEDPSNRLAPVVAQIDWLRNVGFANVDCHWRWLELALIVGFRP